jgi:hypothetical protein
MNSNQRSRRMIGLLITACVLIFGLSLTVNLWSIHQIETEIRPGEVLGTARFPDGDTPTGGHGQPVDGILSGEHEAMTYHIHIHLSLFIQGVQIAVPKGIGILRPWTVDQGSITEGKAFYWLHTHDASGILHVEAPHPAHYTLGQFFDVWGMSLSSHQLLTSHGLVTVYINGKKQPPMNPRLITLTSHEQITLEVGQPHVSPVPVLFPASLPT